MTITSHSYLVLMPQEDRRKDTSIHYYHKSYNIPISGQLKEVNKDPYLNEKMARAKMRKASEQMER